MAKREGDFRHPSAGPCRRDAAKIAIRWKAGAEEEERTDLLDQAGLTLIEAPAPEKAGKDARLLPGVNNSAALSWAEPKGGKTVSPQAVAKLKGSDLVEWVSGVYRAEKGAPGLEGLFTVNPTRLYVRAAAHETLGDLSSLGLTVDEKRTARLRGLVCLNVEVDVISAAASVAAAMESLPQTSVARDLVLENIPLMSPALGCGCSGSCDGGHAGPGRCAPGTQQIFPNDPMFPLAWNLLKINAPAAWALTEGDPDVVVAVLDQGVELGHPDLSLHPESWNTSTDTPDGSPVGNHGTACAGIVAGRVDNGLGAAGVAGKCRIMAIATSTWADVDIAEGLVFAADHGARAVSMSFGVYPSWGVWNFAIIQDALQYALDKGLVLAAASGNENASTSRFPGSDPRTICVGGSNKADERKRIGDTSAEAWWGACYGNDLDLVAPCLQIPTTDRLGAAGYTPNDYDDHFNGTSAATPHVAGLAALILSLRPDLTNIQVREIISSTCDKISPALYPYAVAAGKPYGTWHPQTGYGRINVERALLLACSFGKDRKEGPCEFPSIDLPCIPEECLSPKAPPWKPFDQCILFYEPRFVGNRDAQTLIIYEHCLRLLGRQQGPLIYSTTLLPGETVKLYHYDRYRRVRSETQRLSVHTSLRQSVSALMQSRRAHTDKQYQDLLIKIRNDDDSTFSIGGMLFPVSWDIDNPDLDFTHAQGASVENVSESFSQVLVSASQQVDTERSIVVSTYEEKESQDITVRTLENKNHCRAITYFVRRVLEVYEFHTVVKQVAWRPGDATHKTGFSSWRPLNAMTDVERKKMQPLLAGLPRLGALVTSPLQITVPTDGTLYEAELAHCSSCEPARQVEVELALEKKQSEAKKACLEAELLAVELARRKALLSSGDLKPFETCVPALPVSQP